MTWDLASLKALTEQYEKDSAQYSSWKGMMGPRGKVDEKTRHIAAAAAWGLNPEWDATYLNYSGGQDDQTCHKATYQVPENKAFWSITIYGNDGYMKSENAIVGSSNVKLNSDGTFTCILARKGPAGMLRTVLTSLRAGTSSCASIVQVPRFSMGPTSCLTSYPLND